MGTVQRTPRHSGAPSISTRAGECKIQTPNSRKIFQERSLQPRPRMNKGPTTQARTHVARGGPLTKTGPTHQDGTQLLRSHVLYASMRILPLYICSYSRFCFRGSFLVSTSLTSHTPRMHSLVHIFPHYTSEEISHNDKSVARHFLQKSRKGKEVCGRNRP